MGLNVGTTSPFAVQLAADRPVPATLGGKGASLARLVSSGYPVPRTGVITIEAYRRFAAQPKIAALVRRLIDGEAIGAEAIDEVFAEGGIPDDVDRALLELTRTVATVGGRVAVRSSATVEDMHGSSFAGQYRSLLNIDSGDDDAVRSAVREVWASLWHPAPSAYRQAFGIDQSDVAMAVVVMEMIPATTAGVVFTDDPGGSGGARVEAVEGLGESLVSGERTPSAWVVGGALNDETGHDEEGHDETRPPLPPEVALALELSNDIAESFGTPQDVEWAAVGDEVFVVQARPITVLEDHDGFDTTIDDHELTTAGIVEMVPGVLPPLRWELNRFLLEEAFRSVLDSLGVIRGRAAEDRQFVRRVRGRVAIDFDQLRDAAAGIPGAAAELEQQYFGTAAEDLRPAVEGDRQRRFRHRDVVRDLRTLQTRRHVIEQAEVVIQSTKGLRTRRPELEDWSDERLLGFVRRLVDLAARGLAAELGVAASGAATYRRLELQLGSHLGPEEGALAAQTITSNSSAVVARQAWASAAIFGGPAWSEIGTEPPLPPARDDADESWQDLKRRLRSLPGWTRRRILTGAFVDFRLHLIRRLTEDVVDQLRRREQAKAAVLELGGEARRVHLELGRRFVERGLLSQPQEIEVLSSSEIRAACRNTSDYRFHDGPGSISTVAPDVIRRRMNWLSRYEGEGVLPIRFTGTPDREPVVLPEGDLLDGWAASPGRRRGVARVVAAADGRLDRGEILVAQSTDASWSPLFMRAGAIIVERGGPLSHAAILARELGLPAVLNLPGATGVLDGCTVSVDGDQGVVVIESRPDRTKEVQA